MGAKHLDWDSTCRYSLLGQYQNSRLRVTNTHTQHHNLTVTTTSCPVPFVSCRVRSRRVLSRPVRSCHAQSVAEFAFRSNKHTYTTPQLNSNHNILSVSSTNELKIDQEQYPNFVQLAKLLSTSFQSDQSQAATAQSTQPKPSNHLVTRFHCQQIVETPRVQW